MSALPTAFAIPNLGVFRAAVFVFVFVRPFPRAAVFPRAVVKPEVPRAVASEFESVELKPIGKDNIYGKSARFVTLVNILPEREL